MLKLRITGHLTIFDSMKKSKKPRKQEPKLAVNGSFLDVLKASASHANKKTAKKIKKGK